MIFDPQNSKLVCAVLPKQIYKIKFLPKNEALGISINLGTSRRLGWSKSTGNYFFVLITLYINNKKIHLTYLHFFRKSPHRTLDTALPALAKLGYDGIEIPLKAILHYGKEKFKELINQCNLKVIVMVFTSGPVAPGQYLLIYYLYNFYNLLIY